VLASDLLSLAALIVLAAELRSLRGLARGVRQAPIATRSALSESEQDKFRFLATLAPDWEPFLVLDGYGCDALPLDELRRLLGAFRREYQAWTSQGTCLDASALADSLVWAIVGLPFDVDPVTWLLKHHQGVLVFKALRYVVDRALPPSAGWVGSLVRTVRAGAAIRASSDVHLRVRRVALYSEGLVVSASIQVPLTTMRRGPRRRTVSAWAGFDWGVDDGGMAYVPQRIGGSGYMRRGVTHQQVDMAFFPAPPPGSQSLELRCEPMQLWGWEANETEPGMSPVQLGLVGPCAISVALGK